MIFGCDIEFGLVKEIVGLGKGLVIGWEFVCTQTHTNPYK